VSNLPALIVSGLNQAFEVCENEFELLKVKIKKKRKV
jgi:hypothetical protein